MFVSLLIIIIIIISSIISCRLAFDCVYVCCDCVFYDQIDRCYLEVTKCRKNEQGKEIKCTDNNQLLLPFPPLLYIPVHHEIAISHIIIIIIITNTTVSVIIVFVVFYFFIFRMLHVMKVKVVYVFVCVVKTKERECERER